MDGQWTTTYTGRQNLELQKGLIIRYKHIGLHISSTNYPLLETHKKEYMKNVIKLSDVAWKDARIVVYLLVSGILGIVLSRIADKPELIPVLTPVINYVLYRIEKELSNEGYLKAIKK